MALAHYTDYATFSGAFIGFAQLARDAKLNIGIDESKAAMHTALEGLWHRKEQFRAGLRSVFCSDKDDLEIFERLFDQFWGTRKASIKSKTVFKNQSNLTRKSKATAVMLGQGKSAGEESVRNTSGANAVQALRRVDFSKISEMDSHALEKLADRLFRDMSLRLKRKFRKGNKGTIRIGDSIRKNIHRGGDLFDLVYRQQKQDRYRLVILLDVSGSMDKYSFYLLRFVYALKQYFRQIEAFAFSTRLVRITEFLDEKDIGKSLAIVSQHADHWSSGTRIGQCLGKFNDLYAKRVLNGKTLTVFLSDGLDTGSPEELKSELKKIRLRTKKLVWLNPLKGMEGYLPIQKGMEAALPQLDEFRSAHNLESLLELENILANA